MSAEEPPPNLSRLPQRPEFPHFSVWQVIAIMMLEALLIYWLR